MDRRLVLVKHALPVPDPSVAASEWRLGADGETQAAALAATLEDFEPYFLCTSTETKARQTADIIASASGATVITDDRLREIHRPVLPWMGADEHQRFNRRLFEQLDSRVVGDESARDACSRFDAAVVAHCGDAGTRDVVVVSHGTVIALFVAHHNRDLDAFTLWRELECSAFVVLSVPGFQCVQ
jgi:broad specificity phosphatase PhoE